MKQKIIIIILLFFISFQIHAKKEDFIKIVTIKEIIKEMTTRYEKMRTYKANFYINSIIDNVESWSKGEMKYKAPDTFILTYKHPKDQLIFSDGKVLKIYVPHLNVLGEQSLENYRPGFLISSKSSLYYLKKKFNFAFHKSNKPVMIGETPYYVLELTQKEVTAGFKTIILYVSQHWVITKAEATTINGDTIKIRFSNISINRKITDHEFEFSLPVNTQTVKNPLLFKTEGE